MLNLRMPLYSLLDVYSCVIVHAPAKRILSILSARAAARAMCSYVQVCFVKGVRRSDWIKRSTAVLRTHLKDLIEIIHIDWPASVVCFQPRKENTVA